MIQLNRKLALLLLCPCFILPAGKAFSQNVNQYILASAGGSVPVTGGNSLTFTVGEAIIITAGTNPVLTQGFNQPTISGTPLPVSMDFSGIAQQNYNQLDWTTFQESNNDYFELERSTDGVIYNKLITVPSKAPGGTSTQKINYSYRDNSFTASENFYRLKQVDKNGKQFYAPVVRLQNIKTTSPFSASPNPATNKIDITTPESGELTIIDINGKIIEHLDVSSSYTLYLNGYTAGAYFVNFKGANFNGSIRFVKQ